VNRTAVGHTMLCRLDRATSVVLEGGPDRAPFLGGRGYGVALVATLGSPRLEALHASQPFVLAAGPLTGTSAPSSGRFAAVAPSPLTGTIFDGNAGGRFGVRLRQAGVDALVLTGAAAEWSVVVVDGRGARADGGPPSVRLLPLSEVWPEADPRDPGLVWSRTVAGLRAALGSGYSLLLPSVAGRRGALLGSLRTDDGRNLGRGGLGAALAAKRVFAVAVAGDRALYVAEPDHFSFLVYEAEKQICANPVTSRALPEFGTAVLMQLVHQAGALPALNYTTTTWPGVERISGESVRDGLAVGRKGCFGCRIRCTPRVAAPSGRDGSGSGEGDHPPGGTGPEYETLWALGAAVGVDDLDAIQEANRLCGEYGLDTISTGATIACAMELSEEGLLGRDLRFGAAERVVQLVREMGEGRGFGAELADGSARFALAYGHPEAAMHVKGLELPAYDPRGMHGQGLAYATSNRGACHLRGNMLGPEILGIPKMLDRFSTAGKSGILLNLQHLSAAFDSVALCKFAGFAFGEEVLARLMSAATGEPLAAQDLLRAGERIWNLERLWNLGAGFSRADDTLPHRVLHTPLPDGPAAGRTFDLTPMLNEYYRARGWDEDGVVGLEKAAALGLEGYRAALLPAPAPAGAEWGDAAPGDVTSTTAGSAAGSADAAPHGAGNAPGDAGNGAREEEPKGGGRHLRAVP